MRAMYHVAIDMPGGCCPRAAAICGGGGAGRAGVLRLPAVPLEAAACRQPAGAHQPRDKRRERVVRAFPSAESTLRLVGAVMCDQDEERSEAHYFAELYAVRPEPAEVGERRP